jgi:hypothetical protein
VKVLNQTERDTVIQKALSSFGLDHQIDKMIEELGELLQATIKLRQSSRNGKITQDTVKTSAQYYSFIEELADFDVLRDQIIFALNLRDQDSLFHEIKNQKFERLNKWLSQTNLDDFEG